MGNNSSIQWTDATFNPWWGCTKISPGCDNCYAERLAKRVSGEIVIWGTDAERRIFDDRHWSQPVKWNAGVAKRGERMRVFCASMADVFDNHPLVEKERIRLWKLIRETPNLDWQILTKRIGNALRMLPYDWGDGYPNVWLGATVVNQEEVDRDVPRLLALPARVRFLSCEPLLGPINLTRVKFPRGFVETYGGCLPQISWIIIGGESGPRARGFNIEWARQILWDTRVAGVPVFVKQLGARPFNSVAMAAVQNPHGPIVGDATPAQLEVLEQILRAGGMPLNDRAGGDPSEWPIDLRVREFPA